MTALLRERRTAEEGLAGPWWNEEKGGKDEPEVGTNVEKDAILTRVVHKFGAECWVAMETWRGMTSFDLLRSLSLADSISRSR